MFYSPIISNLDNNMTAFYTAAQTCTFHIFQLKSDQETVIIELLLCY